MFHYPQLTPSEQANLPKLIASPTAMPSKFEDSTHQLWHCQTVQGDMVLKVCNQATISQSVFWFGMNDLFAADFPSSLDKANDTFRFIQNNGAFKVPDLIASQANRFVLTRYLAGKDLQADAIEDNWVIQLAHHIARLHQQTFSHWGNCQAPQFSAQDWPSRLHDILLHLATKHLSTELKGTEPKGTGLKLDMTSPQFRDLFNQALTISETEFVPMMLDLRWDQLRDCENNTLALIDLDAFVIAPKSLDLVLIANLMTEAQLVLFKQHYERFHPWPDYAQQQPCYQLLLFLMQMLGETDLASWMKRI